MSQSISLDTFISQSQVYKTILEDTIKQKVKFPTGGSKEYKRWQAEGASKGIDPHIRNTIINSVSNIFDPKAEGSSHQPSKRSQKKDLKSEDQIRKEAFKDSIIKNWCEIKDGVESNEFTKLQQTAYRLYTVSTMSLLPFKVLGDESIREQRDLRANVGRLCTPAKENIEKLKEMQNFDPSNPTSENPIQYLGSVLYDTNWNIMKNDAVMLGTIHAKQPAYLTFNLETLRTMKDSSFHSGKYIKLQFREILQLATAGYKMVIPSQAIANAPLDLDNIIMINFKPENSSKLTMENLLDALKGIHSATEVREAIGNIECITYEDYLQGKSPYLSDTDTKSITTLKDLLKPDHIERLSISDDSACATSDSEISLPASPL